MAYNTKEIVRDKDGNPVAQYFNPDTDQYEPVHGAGGGNAVILYNEDGTENNSLSLVPILDKLSQLTGTVIDEETRKSNELQRIALYNQISQMLADGELKGDKGDIGLGLEFDWQGTSLGIKVDGDTDFVYVDLRGPQGEQGPSGTIENLDKTHIEDALGYVPADEDIIGQLANLTTEDKDNLVQAINEVKSQSNQIATDVTNHINEIVKIGVFGISANQSIAHGSGYSKVYLNSNTTGVNFATLEDGNIKILKDGLYRIDYYVAFAKNSDGYRQVISPIVAIQTIVQPSQEAVTRTFVSLQTYYTKDSLLNFSVAQTSGVALDLIGTNTFVRISRLGD